MRKGFTLIEILITLFIIAALASILIPRSLKTKEKVYQRQAESYLRAIRISQKMYYARYATYSCSGASCPNGSAIKATLGTEIKDGTYVFSMTSGSATTFTATADSTGTANDITLTEANVWTKGGSPYTPP